MPDREIPFSELIRLVAAGDRVGYTELVRRSYDRLVLGLAARWTPGTGYGLGIDPEDLVQSLFLEISANPSVLGWPAKFPQSETAERAFFGWARQRFQHRMVAMRSRSRSLQTIEQIDSKSTIRANPEPEYLFDIATDRLDAMDREAVRLRLAGYSVEDIAQLQRQSVTQSRNALERGATNLLNFLWREPNLEEGLTLHYRWRRRIEVFYATDRVSIRSRPGWPYGNYRSQDGALSYGRCYVYVPHPIRHRIGHIERPSWWRRVEIPSVHFIMSHVSEDQRERMFGSLARTVADSDRKEAFIFIHGYNVSFTEAAHRVAQLALDLKFSGAPILYSWASAASMSRYMQDEDTVRLSVDALKGFLRDVVRQSGAHTIHIIAHSMGTRALADALAAIGHDVSEESQCASGSCRIRQIVLAAPDINVELFRRLAAAMVSKAERVTLYACAKDKALALSRKFHGYPRAGETVTVIPGIDTIESSAVDTSFLGHGLFATNRAVLTDLSSLLNEGIPPDRRVGLSQVTTDAGQYWAFQK